MLAWNHVGSLAKARWGIAALVAGVAALIACASAPAPTPSAPETVRLSDVQVESDEEQTVVTLLGLSDPGFDAFQDQDPARVVVDLPGVEPGEAAAATAVYDGLVDEVSVAGFEAADGTPQTRVEISLGTVASHEVVAGPDRLTVHLRRDDGSDTLDADTAMSAEVMDDPWGSPVMGDSLADDTAGGEPMAMAETPVAAVEVEKPAAPVAKRLMAVSAQGDENGVTVELTADGRIEGAEEFTLEGPLRLVVDLPGMTSEIARTRTPVDLPMVKAIRVGQHDGKVRIVVDGAEGLTDFGGTRVVPVDAGLMLGLGQVELPEASPAPASLAQTPADASPVPASAAPAFESQGEAMDSQRVHGMALELTGATEKVVILTDGPADYATLHPDTETIVVQIRGATLDLPSAKARIAPENPGAVSLISAFEQPESGQPEVRVLIRNAKGSIPSVNQDGGMLVLDFPRVAEVAEAVPMLQEEPEAATLAEATPSVSEAPAELEPVKSVEPEAAPAPASSKAVAQAQATAAPVPAAIDPGDGSVDILQEGGLIDGKAYSGRRISLDFKDVDIDDVLRLVAEVSDLNIIAGDEVAGQVTIRLVDVPWDQALDVILLTKGLGFVRVGNVLRIAPSDVLKSEEEARLQERRAKEKLEDLVVKLQPVNYASVNDVEKMVKRLLTPRGSVDVDERTNTVILKDIASVIDEATALIKAIDTQTPQVMIEAKIVEARLDFLREIGATWAVGIQPNIDAFDSGSGLERGIGGRDFQLRPASEVGAPIVGLAPANSVAVSNPITQLATGAVNLGAFLLDERFNVDVQLEAAESHGDGKVISSPRVVTLDNRKASIEQGVSIPFQTFENGDAKLEFIDAVLRLDVTPHITADRSIIMKIEVQRNAPDDSVPTPTGSPAIAKNEAETETLVRDGQTLVIGGIYVVRESDRETRVPYLHKIPILGNAFKNKEVRDTREELLVFVTPRIVVNPEVGS